LAGILISGGYDSLYVYSRTVKKTESIQEWGANLADSIKVIYYWIFNIIYIN